MTSVSIGYWMRFYFFSVNKPDKCKYRELHLIWTGSVGNRISSLISLIIKICIMCYIDKRLNMNLHQLQPKVFNNKSNLWMTVIPLSLQSLLHVSISQLGTVPLWNVAETSQKSLNFPRKSLVFQASFGN